MHVKLAKIISCSSEHPSYPASNLLRYRSTASWRCKNPGEMAATVIFQLAEPTCITGVDIGNYRSCVVIVSGSTSNDPDNWIPVVNHQFMTHDEATNNKFRDQVEIFTKQQINPDALKVKFDRVKVMCMQSANLRELFGLTFIEFKTEATIDMGLDIFAAVKMKQVDDGKSGINQFKDKYLKMISNKKTNYKEELLAKVKDDATTSFSKRQEDNTEPMKRPLLEKLEAGKEDEVFGTKTKISNNRAAPEDAKNTSVQPINISSSKPVARTPFGDIIPSPKDKPAKETGKQENGKASAVSKKRSLSPAERSVDIKENKKRQVCAGCPTDSDSLCKHCNRLPQPKPVPVPKQNTISQKAKCQKPKKLFNKLFEGISFSLSGYVNPKRDEIRRKALQMGAKYIADPNTTNKKCTHLICAFKNTPKYQQFKGHSKIVSHTYIEECFDEKKRYINQVKMK